MGFVKVASKEEIPVGKMKLVEANGTQVCLPTSQANTMLLATSVLIEAASFQVEQ
jgi:hypothetical protein